LHVVYDRKTTCDNGKQKTHNPERYTFVPLREDNWLIVKYGERCDDLHGSAATKSVEEYFSAAHRAVAFRLFSTLISVLARSVAILSIRDLRITLNRDERLIRGATNSTASSKTTMAKLAT
jgi:hypothetical protein